MRMTDHLCAALLSLCSLQLNRLKAVFSPAVKISAEDAMIACLSLWKVLNDG